MGRAANRAVDAAYLREQLGRLGNTPYELAEVELEIEGRPFAPSSLLNRLRREAVARLQEAQGARPAGSNRLLARPARIRTGPAREHLPSLHLLVRTPAQLEAAIAIHPAGITLDYLDLYGLKPSLERIRAAGIQARVASPRVLKPGEERIVDFLLSCDCPILVRLRRPAASLARRGASRSHRRFQPERRQRQFGGGILRAGTGRAHPHARSQRRAGRGPGPRCRRRTHRSHRCTSTCRSSTPSTASSAGSCPPARATKTAAVRASVTWWRYATMPDERIP